MSIQKITRYFIALVVLFITTEVCYGQPELYNKMFHPQSVTNIEMMKKSPQKTVSAYAALDGASITNDTDNYLQNERFYNEKGLLVLDKDATNSKWYTYKYDKKGRVIEYLEEYFNDNAKAKPVLHFAVEYSRKGEITAIKNLDKTKYAQSITFNTNTKTILISDVGGYIYRYTLDKKNRLIKVNVEYYQTRPYSSTLAYNKKGLLTEEKGVQIKGTTVYSFTKTYTYKKNLMLNIKEESNVKGNKSKSVTTKTFNYKNGVLNNMVTKGSFATYEYFYFYDESNRTLKSKYLENGKLKGELFYKYY